jgi:hypothetical protein
MLSRRLPPWLTFRVAVFQLMLLAIPFLLLVSAETAYAQAGCSGTRDYGDAPASYGIACATPSATLRIGGVTPDTEASHQASADANGDDNAGTDDETFLNPLTPIDIANAQYIWTIPVSNTTGNAATLAGWIDFNGNGVFEASERAVASVPNNATQATLTWNVPPTASANTTTFVRLRISTDANVGPTGDYPTNGIGEVEDYAVQIVENELCAPGTSFYFIDNNGGDSTIRTFDVSSGTNTLVTNPAALGNINGLAIDRWRGLMYYQDGGGTPPPAFQGLYYYDVVNNAHGTVTANAGATPLNLPLGNGWQSASGAYANSRYYAGIDGGDLGTIYEITLNAAGTAPVSARALITPNAGCGGTQCQNYGDIIVNGNRLYVAFIQVNEPTITQVFDVYDINSLIRLNRQTIVGTPAFAFQLARDGNGQIYAVTSDNGRVFPVNNNVIQNYPTPLATIGVVVNDAAECPLVPMDFGDAPNSYGTNGGPLAARHRLVDNLRLGNVTGQTVIRDLHGFASANANGDDLNNYNGSAQGGTDDEDAVVTPFPLLETTSISYTIPNITVFNNTGTPATLYGWIDFNRDGQFQQNERTTVTVPSNPNPQTVSLVWSTLPGMRGGASYLRLRLSTATTTISALGTGNDGAFLATGYAPDGEVEDYPILISGATAVTLSSFEAQSKGGAIPVGMLVGLLVALVSVGIGAWRFKLHQA